jgi:AcrR family transcriptional regulator
MRDAAVTRRRILDAAIVEFAAYGIAGSRVDRIATAAGCNKAMIYSYYGSKDGLFDAVFDVLVVGTVNDVPINAKDLPGYAAELYDQHRRHPEPLRISRWDALERGGAGQRLPVVVAAAREKVDAIAAAQAEGRISRRFSAERLLELVLTLSRTAVADGEGGDGEDAVARRESIRQAVALLVDL